MSTKKYVNELNVNGNNYTIKDKELRDYLNLNDDTITSTTTSTGSSSSSTSGIATSISEIIKVLGATSGTKSATLNKLSMEIGTYHGSDVSSYKTIQFKGIIPLIVYVYTQDESGTSYGKRVSCMIYPKTTMYHEFGMYSTGNNYGEVDWSLETKSVNFRMSTTDSMSMNSSNYQYYYIGIGEAL